MVTDNLHFTALGNSHMRSHKEEFIPTFNTYMYLHPWNLFAVLDVSSLDIGCVVVQYVNIIGKSSYLQKFA